MAIIYTNLGKSKQRKKPGWEKEKAEHDAWLKKINSMSLFDKNAKPKMQKTNKTIDLVVKGPQIQPERLQRVGASKIEFVQKAATKQYIDPRVLYKDDPEMLARELKARERKFATAPAYNKGPAQFVSEDMDADMKKGLLRRR